MKLGFLTACLPDRSLKEIASWAAGEGFEALEVAAWPALGQRPFTATHITVENFGDEQAEAVQELMSSTGLTISSLAFYDNNLHPDPAERSAINNHVLACIDAAARLGVPTVGTFVGRDWTKPVRENLSEAEEVFKPLVDQAGRRASSSSSRTVSWRAGIPMATRATWPTHPNSGNGCSHWDCTSTSTPATSCGWVSTL